MQKIIQTTEQIDFSFGMSQLSGNESLLIMLLGKVRAEYAGCEAKLLAHFDNEQWEEAKIIVHTLKGVSGNLGCTSLHKITKELDEELRYANREPRVFSEFVDTLKATLAIIEQVEEAGTVELAKDEVNSTDTHRKSDTGNHLELKKLLQDNSFIPPTVLYRHLETIDLDDESKRKLEQYVNTLDYARALDILPH